MKRKKKIQKDQEEIEEPAKKIKFNLASDAKRCAAAVILVALAVLIILGFFGRAGSFGQFFDKIIGLAAGWAKFIFPVFLISLGVTLLFRKKRIFYVTKISGLVVSLLSLTAFFQWFFRKGGYIGSALNYFAEKYLGEAGSLVAILAVFMVGIIVAFNFSFVSLFSLPRKKPEPEEILDENEKEAEEESADEPEAQTASDSGQAQEEKEPDPETNISRIEFVEGRDQYVSPEIEPENYSGLDFSRRKINGRRRLESGHSAKNKNSSEDRWIFPPMDLLEKSYGTAKGGDIEKNFSIIEKTLKDFGIIVEKAVAKTGPTVTQYSLRPAVGVKISKILALQNDLSLALAVPIRIEAPILGQSLIGIEAPNKSPLIVRLRDMLDDAQFEKRLTNLTLALGESVGGSPIFDDLAKMPHLMIAGATGTGKSICINSIITTLLYQNSPEDLKFIMIDPKRVELSLYNGIPHLLVDTVVENGKVLNVLKWAVGEMERRYRLLQDTGSRDIGSYREKKRSGKKISHRDLETGETTEEDLKNLPYIVIVIDELADLMGSHGKEVESAIVRIAQMARAVGIHLIVSTQRPSVEVITGLIKANITTRIAFQVATQIDSRTIIDMGGAEKLLGNGDMLYLSATSPKPRRIQGVLVSESEVKRVVKFIKDRNKKHEKEKENIISEETPRQEILEFEDAGSSEDELLEAAKKEIVRAKKASASFLQRRLRIGYARAARLLDIMEEKGIVGPADGAKPREVYARAENPEDVNYEDKIEDQGKRDKWDL